MPILRPRAAPFHERRISSAEFDPRAHWTINGTSLWRQAAYACRLFWASGGVTFPKMGESLPRMPIIRRAKFDAASFILGGEIRNRIQTQKITNKQIRPSSGGRPYIHTCRRQTLPIDASPLHWRRARSQKGTGVYRQYLPPRADSSDFGRFHAQDAHEPSCKISRR